MIIENKRLITSFAVLPGKTIKNTCLGYCRDKLLITFTDDSYVVIEAEIGYERDIDIVLDKIFDPLMHTSCNGFLVNSLIELGIVTQEDVDVAKAVNQERERIMSEASDLQEFQRLQNKYGKQK